MARAPSVMAGLVPVARAPSVMAGLVPAIHAFKAFTPRESLDGRPLVARAPSVMAGLVPAIHAFKAFAPREGLDGGFPPAVTMVSSARYRHETLGAPPSNLGEGRASGRSVVSFPTDTPGTLRHSAPN